MKVECSDGVSVIIRSTKRFPILASMVENTCGEKGIVVPIPFPSVVVNTLVSKKLCTTDTLPQLAMVADFLGDTATLVRTIKTLDNLGRDRPELIQQLPDTLATQMSKLTQAVAGMSVLKTECICCETDQNLIKLNHLSVCELHISCLPIGVQLELARVMEDIHSHHACSAPQELALYNTRLPLCKVNNLNTRGCPDIIAKLQRAFDYVPRNGSRDFGRLRTVAELEQAIADRPPQYLDYTVDERRQMVCDLWPDFDEKISRLASFIKYGKVLSGCTLDLMVQFTRCERLVAESKARDGEDTWGWAKQLELKQPNSLELVQRGVRLQRVWIQLAGYKTLFDLQVHRSVTYRDNNLEGLEAAAESIAGLQCLLATDDHPKLTIPGPTIKEHIESTKHLGPVKSKFFRYWEWLVSEDTSRDGCKIYEEEKAQFDDLIEKLTKCERIIADSKARDGEETWKWATQLELEQLKSLELMQRDVRLQKAWKQLGAHTTLFRLDRYNICYLRDHGLDGLEAAAESIVGLQCLLVTNDHPNLRIPSPIIKEHIDSTKHLGPVPSVFCKFWRWLVSNDTSRDGCKIYAEEKARYDEVHKNPVPSMTVAQSIRQYDEYKRHRQLDEALAAVGLTRRADSQLCKTFLSTGVPPVNEVAERMAQMRFLFEHTTYASERNAAFSSALAEARDDYYDTSDEDSDSDEYDYFGRGNRRHRSHHYRRHKPWIDRHTVYDRVEARILEKIGGFPRIWPWME